jgi:hypothetical protein
MLKVSRKVVVTARRLECIVIRKEEQPEATWLGEQADERLLAFKDEQWWALMPLKGGVLLMPEPLIDPVRKATYDDVMEAVEHANESGRRTLARLFPTFVAKAIALAAKNAVGQ